LILEGKINAAPSSLKMVVEFLMRFSSRSQRGEFEEEDVIRAKTGLT